ncbi:MAG: tetratricopeptide repeat protein [Clostridia bacterium]|nr:tetratricopeptide repeat protein [Clostridia bacterium]
MKLIFIILLVLLLWYCYKKRSFFTYRSGVKEVVAGDPKKGLELLRKASQKGLSPAQEVQTAYAELKYGELSRAKEKLNLLLLGSNLKPDIKYQARLMMAILRLQVGELDEAKESLETLYEKGYRTTNFYATYGYMAILTGNQEYLKTVNEEAYQYNKDNLVICDNYGLSLFLLGEQEAAISVYEELIAKEPKFPEAYYNYACVLEKAGDTAKAKQMLERSLEQEFSGVTTIKQEQVNEMLTRINSNTEEQ